MNIPIIGELIGFGAQWLRGRNEVKQAELEKKLELVRQAGSWDEIQAQNSATSWKDEWLTILVSVPMVLCFFPSAVSHVEKGFDALATMPIWYQYLVGIVFAASFGVKKVTDVMSGLKK